MPFLPRACLAIVLTAKDREKGFGGGFYGPLVARDTDNPDNLLIWTKDGLIHIRTLPAA